MQMLTMHHGWTWQTSCSLCKQGLRAMKCTRVPCCICELGIAHHAAMHCNLCRFTVLSHEGRAPPVKAVLLQYSAMRAQPSEARVVAHTLKHICAWTWFWLIQICTEIMWHELGQTGCQRWNIINSYCITSGPMKTARIIIDDTRILIRLASSQVQYWISLKDAVFNNCCCGVHEHDILQQADFKLKRQLQCA